MGTYWLMFPQMCKEQKAISDKAEAFFTALFSRYPAVEKAVLYGSRAKGNFTQRSDYDIAVYGQSLDRHMVARLNMEADDCSIAQKVEIQNFHQIKNKKLQEHIERVGVVLYTTAYSKRE